MLGPPTESGKHPNRFGRRPVPRQEVIRPAYLSTVATAEQPYAPRRVRHRASSGDGCPDPEPPGSPGFRPPYPREPCTREPCPSPAVGQPATHVEPPPPEHERSRVLVGPVHAGMEGVGRTSRFRTEPRPSVALAASETATLPQRRPATTSVRARSRSSDGPP